MQYQIRKAREEDLPRIQEIYAIARAYMANSGNPNQWGTTHPPVEWLVEDIKEATLHVVTSGETIHGVFMFFIGNDPTYDVIYEGAWHSDAPYGTIHRIAGDGSGGIFRAALEYCASRIGYLRIDTHHDNKTMQHVVEKAGYRKCGIIYVGDGTPRIAYDRV